MKLVYRLLLLITIFSTIQIASGQVSSKQDILSSLGSKSKWNGAQYILFASSNTNTSFKERSFLIDKSSGKVRFDGKTSNNINLVVLFNFKTKEIDKGYINGDLSNNKADIPLQEILNQLEEDTNLLFLPMFIVTAHHNSISLSPNTIITNGERLTEVRFKNIHNLNRKQLSGAIYLNNKGTIKEYQIDQSKYTISDIKDIGDGILLPTRFTNQNALHHSIKFSTLAAFTTIEMEKFLGL